MNQKLINIILAAAIAVVLFLQLKNGGAAVDSSKTSDTTSTHKIAYVDLDSIQEKYTFYKEKMFQTLLYKIFQMNLGLEQFFIILMT